MSAENPQLQRNEECRMTVRGYLAERNTVAQTAATIQRRLRTEHDFTLDEVKSACAFLEGLEHVSKHFSPDGVSAHYKITSEGVLAWERSLV